MLYIVSTYEKNYAYDSYWYNILFDPDTYEIKEEGAGSTAYYSSTTEPEHQKASKEITPLYIRVRDVRSRLERRERLVLLRKKYGFDNYHELDRVLGAYIISHTCNQRLRDAVFKLLETKNFRSEFRRSLAMQIRAWAKNPDPEYARPLSRKQESALTRF